MLAVGLEGRVRLLASVVLETTSLLNDNKYSAAIKKMNDDFNGFLSQAESKAARAVFFTVGRSLNAFAECLKLIIPVMEADACADGVADALVFANNMSGNPANLIGVVLHFRRFRPNNDGRCKLLVHLDSVHAKVCYTHMKKDILNSDEKSVTYACAEGFRCTVGYFSFDWPRPLEKVGR